MAIESQLSAPADPALEYPRPDVEALVWKTVRDLGSITSWAYTALSLPAPAGWLSAVSVQVDARGNSKAATYARADRARRRVQALVEVDWPDGVVSSVEVVEGPFWNPDVDGAPRYTARYEVRVHPRPAR
jgi:hypothetical protein